MIRDRNHKDELDRAIEENEAVLREARAMIRRNVDSTDDLTITVAPSDRTSIRFESIDPRQCASRQLSLIRRAYVRVISLVGLA